MKQQSIRFRNAAIKFRSFQSTAHFNSQSSAIREASSSSSSSPLKALNLYSRMQRQSLPFDTFSILSALKSCTNLPHNLPIIRHLHAHILKLGFSPHAYVATSLLSVYASTVFRDARILFDEMPLRNTVTWNIMITGYSRQGDIKTARIVFDTMPLRNLASWSAMVVAYMDHSLWNQGVALFRQMLSSTRNSNYECLNPDQLTIGSVLSRCGRMGSVGSIIGKSIHAFAIKNIWELNVEFGTRLVDMYAKCGLLQNACSVFNMIKGGNVVSWTALICGAAQHGHGEEALKMFEKMREAGVKPNELTFTGILAACVRSGLVDEGRRYFRMIDEEYELRPRIEHFGCMVDLFGKAGMLAEAYEVIKTMPFKANVVVWGSFLSSCKLHGEFEMAEKVIDKVMEMVRPENGGVYSLIADLYVLGGKLSEAERLRELMVKQNVRKVRASSFTCAAAPLMIS
ncbi:hypothetical protein ACS0TY_019081 [Phlomoides rotata]